MASDRDGLGATLSEIHPVEVWCKGRAGLLYLITFMVTRLACPALTTRPQTSQRGARMKKHQSFSFQFSLSFSFSFCLPLSLSVPCLAHCISHLPDMPNYLHR